MAEGRGCDFGKGGSEADEPHFGRWQWRQSVVTGRLGRNPRRTERL